MKEFTPQELVAELNKYIVGQNQAKKIVSIAIRNRWRRQQLPDHIAEEITPKNILMIGPTGVGKTEISRRLAKIIEAPFIKVEATKFTEVGYVGRDVEQIIRDLVQASINMYTEKSRKSVELTAKKIAERKILNAYLKEEYSNKEKLLEAQKSLRSGLLDNVEISIEVEDKESNKMPMFDLPDHIPGAHMSMVNIGDMFKSFGGPKNLKVKNLKIKDALKIIVEEESEKLIDNDIIVKNAIDSVENRGIVFIDEIDKITSRGEGRRGAEVSREGVQRDLLPLIEGTTVNTKYGNIKTNHILFITSGAFMISKPSDLIPELQGRLPVRVSLEPLSKDDFKKILIDTEISLIKQYELLLSTENVSLNFTEDAIDTICDFAEKINTSVENIGARRLYTILEKIQEDISFSASDMNGQSISIDANYVKEQVSCLMQNTDFSKFIL